MGARIWALPITLVGAIALSGCTTSEATTHFSDIPLPDKPALSAERTAALLDEDRESAWDAVVMEFPGLSRPGAELIRIISQNEWATVMAECMTEAGFPSTASEDGGLESTFDASVAQSRALAMYVCKVSYPVDPRYSEAFNTSQLRYLYAYYRDVLVPCLDEHEIESTAIPSEQTFVESYPSALWSPYIGVQPPTEQEWLRLLRECPQYPDSLY